MKFAIPAAGVLAIGLILSSPALAQGVETTGQAVAEYNAARKSGVTAMTTGEQIRCAGYWFALEKVQETSGGNSFWTGMPTELSQAGAMIMRVGWTDRVNKKTKEGSRERKANTDQMYAHYQEALRKVVAANETGRITGFFDTLGHCATLP